MRGTNFTDRTSFFGLHIDRLKLTERITRIDPRMIDYRIRVEDPATPTALSTVRRHGGAGNAAARAA